MSIPGYPDLQMLHGHVLVRLLKAGTAGLSFSESTLDHKAATDLVANGLAGMEDGKFYITNSGQKIVAPE